MTEHIDSDAARDTAWLTGGGEMGKLIREKDWSRTPLGPIEQWPQSLRTTVSICLASTFPINIIWGLGRVQIYNDGYWPICGDKHPHSMGQDYKECWFSAWDAVGGPFENASAGRTDFIVNERMFLDRNGYLEETFFTFSLSPIRDESGGVGGLFHPVTEMTQQTLAERRLRVVRDLADRTADAQSVASACGLIGRTLAEHALDVPFALLYLLDRDGRHARLAASTGLAAGATAGPAIVDLDAPEGAGWPLACAARDRQIVELDDVERRLGPDGDGPYPESARAALLLPIVIPGLEHAFGVLVAGVSPRRELDDAYRTFYQMLRDGVTNALTNARAYEEERKRAEALAELDRVKTAFFSNVSHEFRTPLTLMLGPLEEVLAHGLPPDQRERVEVAHRSSLRLLKLVNALLDFSRIEAGRIQAVYEPTELSALTAELASVFRSAIERAGLRLVVDCPPLDEPVYLDREMWEKIVFNLLSNAFKFTFAGEITVRLRRDGERAILTVRDTGTGIPPDEQPRIFERFHRVQGAQGRSFEGTGIGLSLVQELVRLHGGTVRVESQVGLGSAFAVSIPLGMTHLPADRIGASRDLASTALRGEAYVEEALRWLSDDAPPSLMSESDLRDAPVPEPHRTAARDRDGPLARILLADDNADLRDYVGRLLAGRYEVVAVRDGAAALEAARSGHVDLVLADVMMPVMDGFELLAALRADDRTRTLPIIMLSARAGEESRVEGVEAGADDYLVKPFAARELLARVRAHLDIARVRREAEAVLRIERRTEAEERARAEEGLRASEATLAAELADTIRLQEVSSRLLRDGGTEDLYESLVDAAIALMRADAGSMQRLDVEREELRLLAWRGFAPESAAHWAWVSAASSSTCGIALDRGERVVVSDIEACDFMAGTDDLAEYRRSGLRAVQTTPLIARDGRLVGMLSTHWRAPHEPAEREMRVFDVLARQAADLVERHESERSLRASEEQYRTLFESIDEGFCTIEVIFDEDGRPIDYRFLNVNPSFVRQTGLEDAVGRRVRELVPLHEQHWFDIYGRVATTGEAVRFEQRADQLGRFYDVYAFRMGAPEERKVGVLFNDVAERKRLEAERERLVVAEAVAAERQALLKRVVHAQEEERRHLSHEIHDSVTQLAHAASLRLDDLVDRLATALPAEELRDLERARDLSRSAAGEARRLIAGLRPETLDQFGLVGALRAELEAMRHEGWRARFVDTKMTDVRIGEETQITLYRVAQEALANVRKHAGPTNVDVRLRRDDGYVRLTVLDRGRGFDPSTRRDGADLSRQLGLVGMRERVDLLGGRFALRSAPGKGTRIEVVVPILPPEASSVDDA